MKTQTEWVDDIMSAWIGDDMLNYAYQISCLYSTLDPNLIVQVIAEVNEQQADALEEAKENPYGSL